MAEIRQTYQLTDLSLEGANFVLNQIQNRLDQMEGLRGTPTFSSSVDLQGNRITNAGASSSSSDAIIQSELDDMQSTIDDQIQKVWPVGSVFVSTVDTNPADLIGFGTWESFGAGRFLAGYSSGDATFGTGGATGGNKTKDLSHTHDMGNHTHAIDHTHGLGTGVGAGTNLKPNYTGNSGVPSTNTSGSGGSSTQDILPPYVVVYFWKRTA